MRYKTNLNLSVNYQAQPVLTKLQRISWQTDLLGANLDVASGTLTIQQEDGRQLLNVTVPATTNVWREFDGVQLVPEHRLRATVTLTTTTGDQYEDTATFFTATDFGQAAWLTSPVDTAAGEGEFLFSKALTLSAAPVAVTMYTSARGLYELYVGDQKVSADLLTPGWTSYDHTIQYQAYDLTPFFAQTTTRQLNVRLGNGWYLGMLTWDRVKNMFGDHKAFIGYCVARFADGHTEVCATDDTWQSAEGPIRLNEIYDGETIDFAHAQADFLETTDRTAWSQAQVLDLAKQVLTPQQDQACRVTQVVAPMAMYQTPNGDVTIDFGQNLVGRVRVDLAALLGDEPTTLTLRHSEVIDAQGNPYFGNLREAKETVTLQNATAEAGSYAEHFSFQGFRYLIVTASRPLRVVKTAFQAEVIHTPMPRTGAFASDDALLNRLYENIVWGQRGNFVDVPTDCPQRDERLGWTGDTQVFISTGLYNFDGYAFYAKWLRDLASDQLPHGGVPAVIPDVVTRLQPQTHSSAAWGDAAVICPWTLYKFYGDETILVRQYDSMKRWIEFNSNAGPTPYAGNPGFHYGDWLALDIEGSSEGATPHPYLACCFHRYTAALMQRIATILGHADDAADYKALVAGIDDYFNQTYIKDGELTIATQTAQVLALKMIGLTAAQRQAIAARLNGMVINNNTHLNTGFVGTPYLLEMLTQHGYAKTAVALLNQKSFPSWLYSVTKGATTIWEHWDGIKLDGTFWYDAMNSFNHYAFGAVGNWMYRYLIGIDQTEASVGFSDLVIAPLVRDSKQRYVSGNYQSVRGNIACAWSNNDGQVAMRVQVPANTTGKLILRDARFGSCSLEGTYDAEAAAYTIPLSGGQTLQLTYQVL
ncbi:family 78 glycoside hydrolase catalytic domain [Lacticaseibacillus suihuaensis]